MSFCALPSTPPYFDTPYYYMTEKERILQLRELLHRYNRAYYVDSTSLISDFEFDALMHELEALEAAHPEMADPNSPTQRVGSDLNTNEFQTVVHAVPMLSLGNTYSPEEVTAFCGRVEEGLGRKNVDICCELKFDGLSISLVYEHGNLVRAVTRGDGTQGDDVTNNVRVIKSVPLAIPADAGCPEHFEIRGEVLMPWSSFHALNEEREIAGEPPFANPRNAASGTLKSKSSAVVERRKLDAYFYQLICDEIDVATHHEQLLLAKKWGFKVSEHIEVVHSAEEVQEYINHWDTARRDLPVATDGVVLKVDNLAFRQALGMTSKSPRWAIAYKYKADRARTLLRAVTYQVGRTGVVTPVANMDPVLLAGTIVKRASLHNEDMIEKLDLHIGDFVFVEKAGEIIPQIVGVDLDHRAAAPEEIGEKVRFATVCPVCHTPLTRYEGEAGTYCPAEYGCAPQMKGKIEHFVSRDAMGINSIGPKTIDVLYDSGRIRDIADLFDLRISDLCGADGSRERSAMNMLRGIEESKQKPFHKVVFALGIRFVGKVAAKTLAEHFKSMDALCEAGEEELQAIPGIGPVIGKSVVNYFRDEHNRKLVERLTAAGLQMQQEEKGAESGAPQVLAGLRIVISGTFEKHSREEYKALIERCGGKNQSSISSQTSFILAGEGMGPSKRVKAEKLGIEILSEADFLERYGL